MREDERTINNLKVEVSALEFRLAELSKETQEFRKMRALKNRIKSLSEYPKDRWQENKQYQFIRGIKGNLLNKDRNRKEKIIVSVTSYPKRIKKAPAALATLFQQTLKPDKIILWLGEDEFPNRKLPPIYKKLQMAGLTIEFRKDIGPHTRWYYAIKENPEALVITVDDDVMYKNHIVETLYKSYQKNPRCVSAMAYATMRFREDGTPKAYGDWYNVDNATMNASYRYVALQVGGVLYPPHILPEEAFDLNDIMKLSPKQDDIWLKCMEVRNGVKVVSAQKKSEVYATVVRGTQRGLALGIYNTLGSDRQLDNILKKYDFLENGNRITHMMMEDSGN